MADLTITRQDVALSTSAVSFIRVQVAEAVTQGQPLYRAATNSKYYKAAANKMKVTGNMKPSGLENESSSAVST